jgi:uncharacterized membrane protein
MERIHMKITKNPFLYIIMRIMLIFKIRYQNSLYAALKMISVFQLTILIGASFAVQDYPRARAVGQAPSYP